MPLAILPPDPEPTPSELEAEFARLQPSVRDQQGDDRHRNMMRFFWRESRRQIDPDSFLVSFPFWIKEFPDGSHDYERYLQSPLWKTIRHEVLKASNGKCACCPNEATKVHHRDYRPRVMRGEDLTSLVALCGQCHEKVHFAPDGQFREVYRQTESTLAEMVQREDNRLSALAKPVQ